MQGRFKPNHRATTPTFRPRPGCRISKRWGALPFGLLLIALLTAMLAATTVFAANPSANLDQCANDPLPSSHLDGCNTSGTQWVNGNLGASKSVYFEGDSIPYRLTFDNLSTTGTHTVTIEWDTTKSGKHAIDYIDTFNASVANANPCAGVSGCNPASFAQVAIPTDNAGTAGMLPGHTQAAGMLTLFGGTFGGGSVSAYTTSGSYAGDSSTRVTVTFTATRANPVLAWGGHIASRSDWGLSGSAVSIPGSPYHTRLIDLDGSGGNQDRSLSADAVIFPASITIIKNATPDGATSFPFTTTGGLSPATFNLTDTGASPGCGVANTQCYTAITTFTTYTVTEAPPSGWTAGTPTCAVTSQNGGSQTPTVGSVSISLQEGENVTCTFTNTQNTGSLKVSKTLDDGGSGFSGSFTIHYDCGGGISGDLTIAAGGDSTVNNIPTGSSCTVTEPTLPTPPTGYSWGTPVITGSPANITTKGATVSVTVANSLTRDTGSLILAKSLTGGPAGYTGPFTISYVCTDGESGSVTVSAGHSETVSGIPTGTGCTVSEPNLPTPPAGYAFGTPTFSPQATVTIPAGDGSSVTVTTNNTLTPIQTGNIFETGTTCNQFNSGIATELTQVLYGVKNGKINNVAPGVFFWYGKYTAGDLATGVTITQTVSPTGQTKFQVQKSQVIIYDANCNKVSGKISISGTGDPVVITATGLSGTGPYIVSVKYDTSTVVGSTLIVGPWTYTFSDGTASDTVVLKQK
jgi:hypothetical protein